MNELERTELERLIAATGPSGPSEELDARVRQTLLGFDDRRRNSGDRPSRRRLALAFAASVLLAAGIGFLGGRLTADSGNSDPDPGISQVVESSDSAPDGDDSTSAAPSAVAAQTTVIPLPDEQFASLFVQTRSREGLLGAGPVRVEVSNVP